MDRSLTTRAAIGLALALGACGGSVSPDTTTNAGSTTGSGSTGGDSTSSSSAAGTTTATTGGDTVGTTGTSSSSSSTFTSTSGSGTGTGSVGATGTTVGVGPTSTSTSTTTGACDFSGAAGAGGASGDAPAGNGSSGASAPAPAFDAGPAPMNTGILLRLADFPPIPISTGTSSTVSTTVGGGPDPDTQYVILGNGPLTCADPYAFGACGRWRVSIGIPPQDFRVGVFPLHCSNLLSFVSLTFPATDATNCSGGGGGPFNEGTLEITNITDTDAIVRLTNTSRTFGIAADGVYRITRCR